MSSMCCSPKVNSGEGEQFFPLTSHPLCKFLLRKGDVSREAHWKLGGDDPWMSWRSESKWHPEWTLITQRGTAYVSLQGRTCHPPVGWPDGSLQLSTYFRVCLSIGGVAGLLAERIFWMGIMIWLHSLHSPGSCPFRSQASIHCKHLVPKLSHHLHYLSDSCKARARIHLCYKLEIGINSLLLKEEKGRKIWKTMVEPTESQKKMIHLDPGKEESHGSCKVSRSKSSEVSFPQEYRY